MIDARLKHTMNIFLSRVARQTSLRKPILNLASGYQCISSVVTSSSTKSWKRAVFDAECLVNHKGSVINPSDLLGDDLQVITENIRKLLGSGHPVLNTISSYYFNKKGKHIRPLIILLMSRAAYMSKGFQNQTNIDSQISISSDIRFTPNSYSPNDFILDTQRRLAEIVEMIHTASLLHDDVIDDSLKRRSQPSVNAKYGNKMAILAGDFLLSRASVALARLHNFEVVELIAEVISNLVEGEFMQLRHNLASTNQVSLNERWNTSFDYYLDKTYMKTASLIAKSCRASVVLSNASPDMSNAAYNYGKNIGIAFQVLSLFIYLFELKSSLTTCLTLRPHSQYSENR